MNKMTKIALVGLLAAQGCHREQAVPQVPSPQLFGELTEDDLRSYRLVATHKGQYRTRVAEVELGKGTTALGDYENVRLIDRDLDGQVDEIAKRQRVRLIEGGQPPSYVDITVQSWLEMKEIHPKMREVFQEAYSKHQAAQRSYNRSVPMAAPKSNPAAVIPPYIPGPRAPLGVKHFSPRAPMGVKPKFNQSQRNYKGGKR